MSSEWIDRRVTTDAEEQARERLARYATEREERMAEYRKVWERKWSAARAAAARSEAGSSLWRLK
jgi:hypothetical protein